MAVDCSGHFLSGKQCHDLLLRGNKLSGLGLLQRLADEMGEHFNLCTREQLLNPEKTTENKNTVNQKFQPAVICGQDRNENTPFEVKLEVA